MQSLTRALSSPFVGALRVVVALQDSKRGVGLQFGPDITKKFLDDNGLKLVVRSHEVGVVCVRERGTGQLVIVCFVCCHSSAILAQRQSGTTAWR